jgi:hypothetical protein
MKHTLNISRLTTLAVVACSAAAWASDIGGEVEPPNCNFSEGVFVSGSPQCQGDMSIFVSSGLADLALDIGTRGDLDDPWLVDQTFRTNSVDLLLSGGFPVVDPYQLQSEANPTDSGHYGARIFRLTILNGTSIPWIGVNFELQKTLGVPSPNEDSDSISFGQMERFPAFLYLDPYSDRFPGTGMRFEANARDSISFRGAQLMPGESAEFNFMISDHEPAAFFYLRQTGTVVPEPGTAILLLSGLTVAGLLRRRRVRRGQVRRA